MDKLQEATKKAVEKLEKGKKIQLEYDRNGKLKIIELDAHIVYIEK